MRCIAIYLTLLPAVASAEFHRVGGQPVIESDRITDKTARDIPKGNKGNDVRVFIRAKATILSTLSDV